MCDDYHKSLIRDMAKVEYQATLDLDYTLVVEYFHFNIKPSVNFSNRVGTYRLLIFFCIFLPKEKTFLVGQFWRDTHILLDLYIKNHVESN